MNIPDLDEDDDRTFFQRHPIAIGAGILALIGGGIYVGIQAFGGHGSAAPRVERISMITLPPPPPPPPPPLPSPQQTPPPERDQRMEEQTPVAKEEPKPDQAKPDKPPDSPPSAPLGTGITGPGTDGFGLGSSGGNGLFGNGTGQGGGGGSRFGWYAGKVQSRIADALRRNSHTRSACMSIQVRIWPDDTGRITRAQLSGSTGDTALDDVLRNQVLTGLQLDEAPPKDMKLPIVLRLIAAKSNTPH